MNDPAMERNSLTGYANVAALHTTVTDKPRSNKLSRIGADRETDPLGSHDGGGVDPDHLSLRVDQRSSGIARVQGRVGLDDAVDQAASRERMVRPRALTTPAVTVC